MSYLLWLCWELHVYLNVSFACEVLWNFRPTWTLVVDCLSFNMVNGQVIHHVNSKLTLICLVLLPCSCWFGAFWIARLILICLVLLLLAISSLRFALPTICMDLVVILSAALLMPSILSLANQWSNRLSLSLVLCSTLSSRASLFQLKSTLRWACPPNMVHLRMLNAMILQCSSYDRYVCWLIAMISISWSKYSFRKCSVQ